MNERISTTNYFILGFMLFALFFGAGNLIFPAQLGQEAGENLWLAAVGFAITGVSLPLLGIMAIGFSDSTNLEELASRVHPIYGVVFTVLLYMTIGPFFAAPRTGAVAYEIGVVPFLSEGAGTLSLLIFTLIFFGVTLWLSLNPAKLVDRIGKILAPALVLLLVALLVTAFVNPMGEFGTPQGEYADNPFGKGFTEGYNTMDALASLVFGIIVISSIKALGIKSRKGILVATAKSGVVAIVLLAGIYFGIAYLGATSVDVLGLFDQGGPVLSGAADYYFGNVGMVLLAVLITLACLTTSIGLMTASAEYFNTLMPSISYRAFVVFFTTLTFVIANFGLAKIISYSIPMLMFLYPLAIAIMILAFASPLFKHKQGVYIATIFITFLYSIVDGIVALYGSLDLENPAWLTGITEFYEKILPFYNQGLGWIVPFLIVLIVGIVISRVIREDQVA